MSKEDTSDIKVIDISEKLSEYNEILNFQKKLQEELIENKGLEHLILCQHTPVITMGKSAKEENLLKTGDSEIIKIGRGGDATWHGPGQLVCYPVINLNYRKKNIALYINKLEQAVIGTLKYFNVNANRIEGKTGIWIENRKIGFIGVKISRWCTMHGLSINVNNCKEGFSSINPCGFTDIEVSSIEEECGEAMKMAEVAEVLKEKVLCALNYNCSSTR